MTLDLPDGCSDRAEVFGGGRVWRVALLGVALAAAYPVYAMAGADPFHLGAAVVCAAAAAFLVWLQWDAARRLVVVDTDRVWVRRTKVFEGPLDYRDVIAAATTASTSGTLFLLANARGFGPRRRRLGRWGFDRESPIVAKLEGAHVFVVPRLAATAINRAAYAAIGQRLVDAGVPLTPAAQWRVDKEIERIRLRAEKVAPRD